MAIAWLRLSLGFSQPQGPRSQGFGFGSNRRTTRLLPTAPITKPTTCRQLSPHNSSSTMSKWHQCPLLTPQPLPSQPFPAIKAQPQPSTRQEDQPVPAVFGHQQRTHQPSPESIAPDCSHTHQFALLICSNGTHPLKDVTSPQVLLLTGFVDISPPHRSRENASLQQREQSLSG